MEQVVYAILSGAGSGGLVVFMYSQLLFERRITKEVFTLRKEIYAAAEKAEKEAKEHADSKHSSVVKKLDDIDKKLDKLFDKIFEMKT